MSSSVDSEDSCDVSEEEILVYLTERYGSYPFKIPSTMRASARRVIRMRRAKKNGSHGIKEWRRLVTLCGLRCVICGHSARMTELTRDHVVPLSFPGSSNSIDNIQPAHKVCNRDKTENCKDYVPYDVRQQMRREKALLK